MHHGEGLQLFNRRASLGAGDATGAARRFASLHGGGSTAPNYDPQLVDPQHAERQPWTDARQRHSTGSAIPSTWVSSWPSTASAPTPSFWRTTKSTRTSRAIISSTSGRPCCRRSRFWSGTNPSTNSGSSTTWKPGSSGCGATAASFPVLSISTGQSAGRPRDGGATPTAGVSAP